MRRPSTEQTDGDLNRLTTSASIRSNESLHLTQTINSSNDSNNNKNNSSNYLPNIIIASSEYQQCRKRKERQDSISSQTHDRKLVRSNSEEHVPSFQGEVIRRVASHEDFKKPTPLKEHNENGEENQMGECLQPVKEETGSNQPEFSSVDNFIDVSSSQVARLSPIYGELTDEHERRRNSERFLKTKSLSGRKSPRKSRKSSPRLHSESNENDLSPNHQEMRENACSNTNDINEHSPKGPMRSLYPWENPDDNGPVVCQRFAENTFDHVHHSITNFIKPDHDLVKFSSLPVETASTSEVRVDVKQNRNFLEASDGKTRDIMQKSHSPVGVFQTPDERIRQINKRLTSLKKKVSAYEEKFETIYGYRPSQADKTNDKHIKNYVAEIHKLRKEKSQIKADPITAMGYKNKFDDVEKKLSKVKESLVEIEKVSKFFLSLLLLGAHTILL